MSYREDAAEQTDNAPDLEEASTRYVLAGTPKMQPCILEAYAVP